MGIRWQITPVATWVGFKEPLSLAFSQSGRPGIAFYADLNAQLSYYLLDEDTGFWIASPVETGIYAGVSVYPSLKFRNNRPAISYSVQEDLALVDNYELRYAHFTGALPWEIIHVGRPTGWTGTSLAFDPTGRPGISFYLPEGHGIGFVHSPSNFSVWTGSTPDSQAASSHVSLAFTSSGRPAIAYQGYTGDGETTPEIRYAVFDGAHWIVENLAKRGHWCSLAFASSGEPVIAYEQADPQPQAVWCAFRSPLGGWLHRKVADFGYHPSLAFTPSGDPAISYVDLVFQAAVKYAVFRNGGWKYSLVDQPEKQQAADSLGRFFFYPSLAFNPVTGQPAISYYQHDHASIKYAVGTVVPISLGEILADIISSLRGMFFRRNKPRKLPPPPEPIERPRRPTPQSPPTTQTIS